MGVARFLLHTVALSLFLPGLAAAQGAGSSPRWVDGKVLGLPYLDLNDAAPQALALGQAAEVPLDPPVEFRGARYNALVLGADIGHARLEWRSPGVREVPWRPGVLLNRPGVDLTPLGSGFVPGPVSLLQVRHLRGATEVRWIRVLNASGEPATFSIVMLPPDQVAYQYLQVPQELRAHPSAAGVSLSQQLAGRTLDTTPSAEGFAPSSGSIVVFPGRLPEIPDFGCTTVPNWCDLMDSIDPGNGCHGRAGQVGTTFTACDVSQSKIWHFNEGAFCKSCPYTFYVPVECGTAMHLPFRDMEGNVVSITDVFTGTQLQIEGINQCARTPFNYCDHCPNGTIVPDFEETGGVCPAGIPVVPCEPWVERSTRVGWGVPLYDYDGDTVPELPCWPPNNGNCTQYETDHNPQVEEQSVDVVLYGNPALCGVYRLDIVSGGYDWFLGANCTGIVPDINDPATIAQDFNMYHNCSDALAVFTPVPELVLTDVHWTGVCPNVQVVVTVTNIGCVDSNSCPISIDFSRPNQGNLSEDLGVVAAGTAVQASYPVTLVSAPQAVTVTVDPNNVIAECTEQPAGSFSGCQPTAGNHTQTINVCNCANAVTAAVASTFLFSCDGQPAVIDASGSSAVPCTGSNLEYRFLDSSGGVARDWSPDPTFDVVPPFCPSQETYSVEVRCAAEPSVDCTSAVHGIEVECAQAQPVSIVPSQTSICAGQSVTLTASGGFVSYQWTSGQTGQTILVRPIADTTYGVTVTDVSGCQSSSSVAITVQADPIPGPLGNSLRCRKEGNDVAFTYGELPQLVGGYELIAYLPDGNQSPCAARLPPDHPWPLLMQTSAAVDTVPPGTPMPALHHFGGVSACPGLIFYVIAGTSPCTQTRGATCNGWPHQRPPCP